MENLFHDYWWLLFPLSWFVFGGLSSVVNYYRHKNVLKIIKAYADRGEQPPEAVLRSLEQSEERGGLNDDRACRNGGWFSVVLFGVMSAGFGYASYTDMYGAGDAFLIVSFVLGALCLASLVSALMGRRSRD